MLRKDGIPKEILNYSGSNDPDEVSWFRENTNGPKRVGLKKANTLGIYDMSGNVAEWCSDYYDDEYYSNSELENPKGPIGKTSRVIRGGSYDSSKKSLQPWYRDKRNPTDRDPRIGCRCVWDL